MGSGKSTVASLLAARLGWKPVDVDREVEREFGRTVPEIFRSEGEEAFRRAEHGAALGALAREEVVIASGGGWPCRPGRLESLDRDTLTVWLEVSPAVAVKRAQGEGNTRPLLAGADPLGAAEKLMQDREPYYRKALWRVSTDARSPAEVAALLEERLRTEPGRPLKG